MNGKTRPRSLAIRLTIVLAIVLTGGLTPALSAQAAPPAAPPRYEIRLLGERFTPEPGVPAATRARLAAAAAASGGTVHVLVQLHETPPSDARLALRRDGLDLGAYVPGSAWIAAVPAERVASLAARPEVRWLTVWDAARKLHPRLQAGELGDWTRDPDRQGAVMLFVQLHHDVAVEALEEVAARVGGTALPPVAGLHGSTVWLPAERIADLAAQEEVLWIEEGPAPLTPTLDGVRATMTVDAVQAPPTASTAPACGC